MQMKGESCRAKMVVEETLYKTKRFFLKTFRNIQFFLFRGYKKLPKNPFSCPVFSASHKIGPKLQETDDEALNKEQRNVDDQCSRVTDQSGAVDSKEEEKKARKYSLGNEEEPSFLATENLVQKIEELEKMDVNNGDHVMDIDEVIHQYSLLTSPVYLDIVDKFFTDVYVELYVPQSSKNLSRSMRKSGSMRKLNSGNTSMRKLNSGCIHGSMRNVGPASVHGSMRRVGSSCIHGSMRKMGPVSVHGSMRKVGSTSVHGSMRKLGRDSSMRNLGPLKL